MSDAVEGFLAAIAAATTPTQLERALDGGRGLDLTEAEMAAYRQARAEKETELAEDRPAGDGSDGPCACIAEHLAGESRPGAACHIAALKWVLTLAWADLAREVRHAYNGRWSSGAKDVLERIEWLSALVGPVSWTCISLSDLASGFYEAMSARIGITVDPAEYADDAARWAEQNRPWLEQSHQPRVDWGRL